MQAQYVQQQDGTHRHVHQASHPQVFHQHQQNQNQIAPEMQQQQLKKRQVSAVDYHLPIFGGGNCPPQNVAKRPSPYKQNGSSSNTSKSNSENRSILGNSVSQANMQNNQANQHRRAKKSLTSMQHNQQQQSAVQHQLLNLSNYKLAGAPSSTAVSSGVNSTTNSNSHYHNNPNLQTASQKLHAAPASGVNYPQPIIQPVNNVKKAQVSVANLQLNRVKSSGSSGMFKNQAQIQGSTSNGGQKQLKLLMGKKQQQNIPGYAAPNALNTSHSNQISASSSQNALKSTTAKNLPGSGVGTSSSSPVNNRTKNPPKNITAAQANSLAVNQKRHMQNIIASKTPRGNQHSNSKQKNANGLGDQITQNKSEINLSLLIKKKNSVTTGQPPLAANGNSKSGIIVPQGAIQQKRIINGQQITGMVNHMNKVVSRSSLAAGVQMRSKKQATNVSVENQPAEKPSLSLVHKNITTDIQGKKSTRKTSPLNLSDSEGSKVGQGNFHFGNNPIPQPQNGQKSHLPVSPVQIHYHNHIQVVSNGSRETSPNSGFPVPQDTTQPAIHHVLSPVDDRLLQQQAPITPCSGNHQSDENGAANLVNKQSLQFAQQLTDLLLHTKTAQKVCECSGDELTSGGENELKQSSHVPTYNSSANTSMNNQQWRNNMPPPDKQNNQNLLKQQLQAQLGITLQQSSQQLLDSIEQKSQRNQQNDSTQHSGDTTQRDISGNHLSSNASYLNVAKAILMNSGNQIGNSLKKAIQQETGPQTSVNNDPNEVFSNLKAFLQYLEKKKIINITEVVQDKTQVNALIQDIMKLDLNKFNESRQQKLKKLRSNSNTSSNNNSRGTSQNTQHRRRQGTPVNLNPTVPTAGPQQQQKNQPQSNVYNLTNQQLQQNYNSRHSNVSSQHGVHNNECDNQKEAVFAPENSQNVQSDLAHLQQYLQQQFESQGVANQKEPHQTNNTNGNQYLVQAGNGGSGGQPAQQVIQINNFISQQQPEDAKSNQQANKSNYNSAPQNAESVGGNTTVGNYSNYQWVPRRQSPNPTSSNNNAGPQPMHIPSRPNSTGAAHPNHHRNALAQQSSQHSGLIQPNQRYNQSTQNQQLNTNGSKNPSLQATGSQKTRRGNSADQGMLKRDSVLRLSRGSSAKRTAKEIVDYQVPDLHSDKYKINEKIMKERDKLIRFNKAYCRKHKALPPTSLEFYKFVQEIGKGAFGQVTLGIHKLTGRYVAIKAIDKSYMKDAFSKQKVMQEVYILKKIRHSNIIRLQEVFESQNHVFLVTEYVDSGDLLQYVKKHKKLKEQEANRIFIQILHGLAHCHCRSVLHRDVKLDNVLMSTDGSVKICDFGVSRLIMKDQVIQEQCGTPAYLAPEIIADKGYTGFTVDIWSLGVLLYTLLQGQVPYKGKSLEDLHKLILRRSIKYPVTISDQARDLIEKMLQVNPSDRITIPQILKHPWTKQTGSDPYGFPLCSDDDDDDHDFLVGFSFKREQCNFDPISGAQKNNGQSDRSHANNSRNTSIKADSSTITETQETNPMQQIGNINEMNIANLFQQNTGGGSKPTDKLSYQNYCAVTQDFGTYHIDEEALRVLESFGYPRNLVISALNKGELNHATTCYNLLVTI